MTISVFAQLTRRYLLAGSAGGSLAAVLGFGVAETRQSSKVKRFKKKLRQCRKRKRSTPVTCADVCPAEGGFVFHLFGGGDVCATGADPSDCLVCDTHGGCSGVGMPRRCVQNFTNLATGAVGDFSSLCGAYPQGLCADFEPCVLES